MAAALAALVTGPLTAQGWAGRGRLRGVAKDEAGEPVAGASVSPRFGDTDRGPDPL